MIMQDADKDNAKVALDNDDGAVSFKTKRKLSPARVLIASVLILIGAYMLSVSGTIYFRGVAALNYKMIDGTVSGIEEFFDPFGLRKEASMSYVVAGKTITANAPIPEGRVLKKGEATVVFCDVTNPKNIVLYQEIDYDMVTVMGAFGLFALSFGTLVAFKSKV